MQTNIDDHSMLVQRIEWELRRQPPLPDDVLRRIITVLNRGHEPRPKARVPLERANTGRNDALPTPARAGRDPSDVLSLQIGERSAERRASPSASLFHCAQILPQRSDDGALLAMYENVREKKVRELQAMMDGTTGKYMHADAMNDGSTQIGGMRSKTPSMVREHGSRGELVGIARKLAQGPPPYIQNGPEDFRF